MNEVTELKAVLDGLLNKICWSVIAGAPSGSTIHLSLGAKIPRRQTIRNPHLSPTEQSHEGEFSLFVQSAWRLEQGGAVLCGSTDDNEPNGPMVTALMTIVNQRVTDVAITEPVPDATLSFTSGLVLRIFCDQTNLRVNTDNYWIRAGNTILSVAPRGNVVREVTQAE